MSVERFPVRAYHATTNPNFRIDRGHVPVDFFGVHGAPGLFASLSIGHQFWYSVNEYHWRAIRALVVLEIDDTRDDAIIQGRWMADEMVITDLSAVTVERVIPTEYCTRSGFGDIVCGGAINPWGSYCGLCGEKMTIQK